MPRMPNPPTDIPFLEELLAAGEGAPSVDRRTELARAVREMSADTSRQLDRHLFERADRLHDGLVTAQGVHEELRELVDRLESPPWHPALFLRSVETPLGPRAMVLHGDARRIVAVADGIEVATLGAGEEVYLGKELSVVAGRSPYGAPRYGETAFFERNTADGRCVLRCRDEEVVVDVAAMLEVGTLRAGDQVRWDRSGWLALERLEAAAASRFLLSEVPDLGRACIGGQDDNLEALLSALTASLVAPDKAELYGVGGRQSVLMVGPPGCGKTLMARIAAAEVARLGGRRCRFGVVKPAEWESPWVGTTQANIRNCFKALRDASDGYAVLFLDEIESIGRIRGSASDQHGDKFLAALLAELDGFTGREGIAIIAATNRKDLVDPALLERLSDIEIQVRRPDLRGARAIVDIHLPATLPLAAEREEIIETAVSRFYSPNAENELAVLRFRDGKTRTVVAREVASGRLFAQICRAACQTALLRDVRDGVPGLRLADMEHAVADAMDRLASTLSVRNLRAHLVDLPQDVDVVSVEPVVRKVARPHRYRNAA